MVVKAYVFEVVFSRSYPLFDIEIVLRFYHEVLLFHNGKTLVVLIHYVLGISDVTSCITGGQFFTCDNFMFLQICDTV